MIYVQSVICKQSFVVEIGIVHGRLTQVCFSEVVCGCKVLKELKLVCRDLIGICDQEPAKISGARRHAVSTFVPEHVAVEG